MTRDEFQNVFDDFVQNTSAYMVGATPFRTGRMMREAFSYAIPKGIAIEWSTPYTVYTVEKWVSPRWRGRQNPNEGWIERAVELRLNLFTAQYGGKYDGEVVSRYIK